MINTEFSVLFSQERMRSLERQRTLRLRRNQPPFLRQPVSNALPLCTPYPLRRKKNHCLNAASRLPICRRSQKRARILSHPMSNPRCPQPTLSSTQLGILRPPFLREPSRSTKHPMYSTHVSGFPRHL